MKKFMQTLWCLIALSLCHIPIAKPTSGLRTLPGGRIDSSDSASSAIKRSIDIGKTIRNFPDLVAYRNSSLQKAPPPILAEVSEKEYGKPKITRCWLNLDEMWDYRTREFIYNFKIGVDKYKDIKDKHRETWDWEVESPTTYYDYLKAFSQHSDEIMLTIRRYERDILDGKLPISMDDWKMLFKAGLKHYKLLFPNIKYIEVGNEYELASFMAATNEEYYQFYKLGYEAVNEVNDELNLMDNDRILVGGPIVTEMFMSRLDRFFELYGKDETLAKRLDFVSWHEYTVPVIETAHRERGVRDLLLKNGLPENIPLFITEHDPYHYKEDKIEYHQANAAGLIKTLYYSSLYSPNLRIFPWVLYHNSTLQTRFMWFDGPNEADTKADEMHMLPIGASMKLLSMHKGQEVFVENSIDQNDLVLASVRQDTLIIEAANYGDQRSVAISLHHLNDKLGDGKISVNKYVIDSKYSNHLTNPKFTGGIEKVEEYEVNISNEQEVVINHSNLENNGIVLWEFINIK